VKDLTRAAEAYLADQTTTNRNAVVELLHVRLPAIISKYRRSLFAVGLERDDTTQDLLLTLMLRLPRLAATATGGAGHLVRLIFREARWALLNQLRDARRTPRPESLGDRDVAGPDARQEIAAGLERGRRLKRPPARSRRPPVHVESPRATPATAT
jgi:hypothetical protein